MFYHYFPLFNRTVLFGARWRIVPYIKIERGLTLAWLNWYTDTHLSHAVITTTRGAYGIRAGLLRFSSRDLHVLQDETYDIYHGPDYMGSSAHEMAEAHLRSSMIRLMRELERVMEDITVPASFTQGMQELAESTRQASNRSTQNEMGEIYQFAVPAPMEESAQVRLFREVAEVHRRAMVVEVHRRAMAAVSLSNNLCLEMPIEGVATDNDKDVQIEMAMQGDMPLPPRKWHIHIVRMRSESHLVRSIGRPQYLRKHYKFNTTNGTYTEERIETVTPGCPGSNRSDSKIDT